MLQPYKNVIESTRIILASQSPRRVDIMKVLRIPVEVIPSPFDEENNRPDIKDHVEFAIWTAHQKAKVVAEKMKKESDPPRFVIGADSIVTLGGKLYGKPENDDDARETLKALSGQIHNVITGVSLIEIKGDTLEICDFAETTEVKFTTLDSETIDAYIGTGEHKGKAGAYGIQEMGGSFVEHIKGDYYNVVGLPVHRFTKELIKLLKQ